jgi:hypothetical protein
LDTTNIKNILVNIYSYKEKDLISFIDSLIEKSSKNNNIYFYINDQNNLTRLRKFVGYKNVFYNVIWWDELQSPNYHIAKTIDENSAGNYDYALIIKRSIGMPQNWDQDLISNLPENSVLSGMGTVNPKIKNNFYIDKNIGISNTITKTSYADSSFMFGKYSDILKIEKPLFIKYYGEDEYISMSLLNQKIDILSLPSGYYTYQTPELHKRGYVPFSLHHNYNEVIRLLLGKSTTKIKPISPNQFIESNNLVLDGLNELPFDFNDIEYDRSSPLDNIGGKRYIDTLNEVS